MLIHRGFDEKSTNAIIIIAACPQFMRNSLFGIFKQDELFVTSDIIQPRCIHLFIKNLLTHKM